MISEPTVSIITVTYNSEATLERTIRSILAQSVPPAEYIIVDGCSSDRTLEIAKGYREQLEDKGIAFTIVSEPDDGIYVSYGKNAGIMLDSERPENPEILITRLRDTAKIKSSVSNSDLSFYRFKSVEMQYEN